MSLCKLEFFENQYNSTAGVSKFVCVHHDLCEIEEIDDDYLAPEDSEIMISLTDKVAIGQIMKISGGFDFLGYVLKVGAEDEQTVVTFQNVIALFDNEVLFPTNHQDSASYNLESDISAAIVSFFKELGDNLWDISQLSCTTNSITANYSLGLTADSFAQNRCKVNLLDDILGNALAYYGIVATPSFTWDSAAGSYILTFVVGTISGSPLSDDTSTSAAAFNISADNPLVKVDSFTVDSASENANVLKVYSTANTTLFRVFYLHNDGREPPYDHLDEARITPVHYALEYASGTGTSFYNPNNKTGSAMNKCKSFFKNLTWKSNIELRVSSDDPLIHPKTLVLGQICRIWYNGKTYESILTGKKYGAEIVLIFGTVRTTLTKQMKLQKKK